MLPLIMLIGAGVMAILWPIANWSFGLTAEVILAKAEDEVDEVRRTATMAMILATKSNDAAIKRRVNAYQATIVVLLLETVVLVLALVIGRR